MATRLRVKRELESGWYQWFTYQLPALLTIQSGISQIRYASLKGHHGGEEQGPVAEVTPDDRAVRLGPSDRESLHAAQNKADQMLGNGDAKAGAVELVEKLRSEVRVI